MSSRPTLHRALTVTALVATVLMLLLAMALVFLTSYQNRISRILSANMQSLFLAEEAEIDLLLMDRARDPLLREHRREGLQQKLEQARRYAVTREEKEALRQTEETVQAYLAGGEGGTSLEPAFRSLEWLVEVNVNQAQEARRQLDRSDAVANIVGLVTAAVFLIGLWGTLGWIRHNTLRPILSLGEAIDSFHRGNWQSRAPQDGPREIAEMARRFNELASTVVTQREAQLAYLGGVAHDLRTPLAALRLVLGSALPKEGAMPSEEKLRRTLGSASRQVTRLERMVSDVLDAARVEAGHLEVSLRPVDARVLVQEAVSILDGSPDAQRLELQLPADPLTLICDPLRVEQVLNNLISNALKYSPRDAPVVVALRQEPGQAVFEVRDQGIGLSQDDQQRLFEPFRRVGLSKEAVPGVGLGLFVVKRLVEAHRGKIRVVSSPGAGALFEVRLPLVPPVPPGGA